MPLPENKCSFAIGIPTINRWDLLAEYIHRYAEENFKHIFIYILDNGIQGIANYVKEFSNVILFQPTEPVGVAASWNMLLKIIYHEHTHGLILNDDIYLNKGTADILSLCYQSVERKCEEKFILSQKGFCAFLLPKIVYKIIGGFDENFKGAYFEDKDYERRLRLSKMDIVKTAALNPMVYHESSSIGKDPKLNDNYKANWEYYQKKWGGHVGGEQYLKPFNK